MKISKDVIKAALKEKFSTALKSENPDAITDALTEFAEGIQQDVLEDFKAYKQTQNAEILAKRGIRQLTETETKFYDAVIKAVQTGDIKAAFTGLDNAFPQTVIDSVIDDIKLNFPLLSEINFQNTSTLTKFIVNKKGVQLAVWGALGTAITKELEGAVGKVDLGTNKLTAFIPISKDMLSAGPAWVDAYIRTVLAEANAGGLEKGIVTGTGNNEPIGMDRSVADNVTVTGGVYPQKTPIVITDLKPVTYGNIAKTLATGPNGRYRAVPEILLVVNPSDYFTKIMPATTVMTAQGTYAYNVFPYPTKVVQSAFVDAGKAIFGLASRYFMGIGVGGSGGKIEYSDEVKFLDDERVYITRLYGNGMPLDDNAFVLADISGLTAANLEVTVNAVKGVVTTKTQA